MLKPGDQLSERYTVERTLGQGGMGAVYLASMDALGGKKVAIKEMEHDGSKSDERESALVQFKTEATFLAHLEHPNLVQVTDFFVQSDKYYLVMAYVSGQTLQQKLAENGKPFTWLEIADWADSLCAVIGYLHAQDPPILFRDLKPSNIMIEESGRLKLIDFGIARSGQAGSKTSTFLQGTGTSGFSPIEQYGGAGSTDERSDIYSLGATLYTMLTGLVPPDAVARISHGQELMALASEDPNWGPRLDRILQKAMAQRGCDRYSSVSELSRDLKRVTQSPLDDGVPTEDLRKASPGVAQAAASTMPRSITVEMQPTGTAASPSRTHWIAAGSLASVACFVAVMLASSGWTFGPPSASSTPSTASVIQAQSAGSSPLNPATKSATEDKPRPALPSTTKSTDDGSTVVRPLSVSQPKPQVREEPKPQAPVTTTKAPVAALKIDSGTEDYPKATPRVTPTPEWDSAASDAGRPPPPPVQGPDGRWLPPPPRPGGPGGRTGPGGRKGPGGPGGPPDGGRSGPDSADVEKRPEP